MSQPSTSFCKLPFALLIFLAANAFAQPKITGFSPSSAKAGATVTITGTGFNSGSLTANVVYFGATRADVTLSTSSTLLVTVPAGATYQPISVLNTATGLTGYSSTSFLPTFASAYSNSVSDGYYQPKVDFPTGSLPYFVAIADLNNDRKPDLVVANANANTLSIFRNTFTYGITNASSFAAKTDLPVGTDPRCVAVGDLDGDGRPDIAVANAGASTISVLRNTTSDGSPVLTFAERVNFSTGSSPFSVVIGDMDGDGKPDLVVANQRGGTVSVLQNNSLVGSITGASFAARTDFTAGEYPRSVVVSDLDADGRLDIAVANERSNTVSVLRNTSVAGPISVSSFAPKVDFSTGSNPNCVIASNTIGDEKPDLVIVNYGSNTVSTLQNVSTPGALNASSFSSRIDDATGPQPFFVATGDVDGNGGLDMFLVNTSSSTASLVSLYSFSPNKNFSTGNYPVGLAIGDLDGNGTPELVSVNGGANSISVLTSYPPVPPVISSFTPASGPPGTTVTINGSGFNSRPENNSVYFGAVKGFIKYGGSNSLTVTVPAGATNEPISLLNNGSGLTGYSSRPFAVTFSNPFGTGIPSNFYRPKVDFSTGAVPFYVAVHDLDGDGKPDLAVVNSSANTVSLLRNTTTFNNINASSFAAKTDLTVGADPRAVAAGDLDGDGKPELVVANSAAGTLSVLRNTSTAGTLDNSSFAAKTDLVTGTSPFSVAIGDLNGDGKPDLVVANLMSGTVSVFRNTYTTGGITAASFASKADYPAGSFPRSVAISDLDGDGKMDIAVVNEKSNTVSVLRNTVVTGSFDASSFAPMVGYATGSNPASVAATDLDGDGRPDLAIANYGSNSVSVLRNVSAAGSITAASFTSKVDFATGGQPFFVAAGDADGDGRYDLLTANTGPGTLSVLRNVSVAGSITPTSFVPKFDFTTGGYPLCAALGDLDGDGAAEAVALNAGSNSVSVLKIASLQQQPPVITSFSPAAGPAGSTVTITGTNFNPNPASNTVYFGTAKATVTGGSATSLTVIVPAGTTYLLISALDNSTGLAGFSAKPFDLTFTNPFGSGIPANFYKPQLDLLNINDTRGLALGDLDGDGKLDLVTVNGAGNSLISVYRNISTPGSLSASSFAPKVDFTAGAYPVAVGFADIDGDGKLDIVVVNAFSFSFSVLRNTSATGAIDGSSFAPRVDFSTGDYPSGLLIRDDDKDGKPDVEITYNTGSNAPVSIYRNLSVKGSISGTSFGPRTDINPPITPLVTGTGDADGDGKVDYVYGDFDATGFRMISVQRNTSTTDNPVYAPKVSFATGNSPFVVGLADLDGDGVPEVVFRNDAPATGGGLRLSVLQVNSPAASQATASAKVPAAIQPDGLAKKDLQVYPNPTAGEYSLQLQGLKAAVATLEILNAGGTAIDKRTLRTDTHGGSQTLRLSLRGQPAGVYYVKLTSVEGVQVVKVVVQR